MVSMKELVRSGALEEVLAVYRDLDARPVERACVRRGECCHFEITGRTPAVTLGEALLVARAVRAQGKTRLAEEPGGRCPLLLEGQEAGGGLACAAYEARPFGCRTHFCRAAGGPIPRRNLLDLIRRLEALDRALGGDGPHDLSLAVARAMEEPGTRRGRYR
ncbi:MAG: YkgJ family cysteine cluster protein [Planctomycetes bacterium]|nr:YkgJ family cysteine cluster protein [Planctomycetota bacterium]